MSIKRQDLPEPVNLRDKFSLFSDYWSPKIVGETNDSLVKAVKLKGEFVWHHHEAEDELFLVVDGRLRIQFRGGHRDISRAACITIPGRAPGHQPWRIHNRASRTGTLPPHPD